MLPTIRRGAENLLRNWVTALPTILVLALVATMFHSLLVMHQQAAAALQRIEQKFSLTIYLKDGADSFEVGNLVAELEKRNDVLLPVIYTSKEQAWELMSKTFSLDNELLKKYQFSLPASITITPRTLADSAHIENFLQTSAAHLLKDPLTSKDKQKNLTGQMLEFLQSIRTSMLRTMLFFIMLFVIGGTLLVSSTIHLAITSRHREISIMKLVGAKYSTVTTPFVVEGIFISIAAFMVHFLLIVFLPFGWSATRFQLNALAFEGLAMMSLSAIVSYLTTVFHIHKKTRIF